ncbi:MAG: alpha-glucosidase/alpha-galactosidase, partial [Promethearchaeota archaeon]
MKIVYIGAGSFRFSYQLFRNFAALAKDYSYELWLIDINAPLLDIMTKMLKRIIKKYHLDDKLTLYASTDRTQALENADIVMVSISVGQQTSELVDVHIPLKFGIPQTVGDTVGPGGIFRALRVVPIIKNIILDVQEYCPHATVLCYTNPMTTSVYGALKSFPNIETLGICHELM